MEVIIKCSDDCRGDKNIYGEPIEELVRCKDCKRTVKRSTEIPNKKYCPIFDGWVRDNDYCSFGRTEGE